MSWLRQIPNTLLILLKRVGYLIGVKKGFKGKKNPDLWRRFLLIYKKHKVKFEWVKGHNNHPENERCDSLAVHAASKELLPLDKGYEDFINLNKGLL